MNKKIIRLEIRLSPTEYKIFMDKKDEKGTMSQMIRDAVNVFNPIETKGKLATINELSSNLNASTVELNRIGNNINQIAHVLNVDFINNLVNLQRTRDSSYKNIENRLNQVLEEIAKVKKIETKIYKRMLSK